MVHVMYSYCYVYVFLLLHMFHSVYSVFIVLFYVLFVCKCLLYYCHQVSTQLHLTNISSTYVPMCRYNHASLHDRLSQKLQILSVYTIELCYNNLSLCNTLSIALCILWHRSSRFCGTNQLPVSHMVFSFV
jgi:hypothetical protein